MKALKPGQYYSPDGHKIVRVATKTSGCDGCLYKKAAICPNTVMKGSKREPVHCDENYIIFVKPQ